MNVCGLSLGDLLIDQLVVSGSGLNGLFPSSHLILLVDSLSSKPHIGDQSLDLRGFLSLRCGSILFTLEGSSGDVLFDQSCSD